MPVTSIMTATQDNMEKAIAHLQKEFRLTRTGAACMARAGRGCGVPSSVISALP